MANTVAQPWDRYRTMAATTPEQPSSPGLFSQIKDLGKSLGERGDKLIAGLQLSRENPDLFHYLKYKEMAGLPVSASDYYTAINQTENPGYTGPSTLEKLGSYGTGFLSGPLTESMAAGGAGLGSFLGPVGTGAGFLGGGLLGIALDRYARSRLNPELAGMNVGWDLAPAVASKVLKGPALKLLAKRGGKVGETLAAEITPTALGKAVGKAKGAGKSLLDLLPKKVAQEVSSAATEALPTVDRGMRPAPTGPIQAGPGTERLLLGSGKVNRVIPGTQETLPGLNLAKQPALSGMAPEDLDHIRQIEQLISTHKLSPIPAQQGELNLGVQQLRLPMGGPPSPKSVEQLLRELPPVPEQIPTLTNLAALPAAVTLGKGMTMARSPKMFPNPGTMGLPNQPDMIQYYRQRASFDPLLRGLNPVEQAYLESRQYSPRAVQIIKNVRDLNQGTITKPVKKPVSTAKFR